MEQEDFNIREHQLTSKERDFENALRPLSFEDFSGQDVSVMVDLDVPEEELMVRLIKRGKDSGRADDNEETIKKRLHVYHSQTAPLIDWYKNEKKYQHINGLGTMEGIFAEICEAVDKL